MRYEGSVFRPPSEAYSLIIQATIGCSHNKCTFCSMYKDKKFRIRDIKEIEEDLEMARNYYSHVKRIFLADGNALVLKTENLEKILLKIKELFPECERVGIYSAPKDILRKSVEELKHLKKLGLGIAYLGVESGSDEILEHIQKGVTSEEIIQAGKRIVSSGINLSVTLISGLGGKEKWLKHAKESARIINEINPHYLGLLTLLIQPGTKIYDEVKNGEFKLLTPKEVVLETKELIENLNVENCIFRSNHASNYVALAGTLPNDKKHLLKQLSSMLEYPYGMKDEMLRRL
ncbi:B12-binding domain-containing radical SAM protein [Crassaminicella thermophila]|uniref:B12-binding domain-containing radical SAM protein n=1 Tax=Crassaminicella thermophila TaxID=2599308 RepID=A0A5C0SFF8_CRATE|nr:radical SAM protein [Crassaminicella thermophila]QEK12477.1 B12-binding domain-containing radical SAM protein [Crassaminicella thermophila]